MRWLLILILGCSSETTPPAGFPDAAVDDRDGGVDPGGPEFEFEIAAGSNSDAIYGDNAVLAIAANGEPAIAYGVVPAGSAVRELHLAVRSDGTWTTERAVIPGANAPSGGDSVGLGFGFVGAVPHLVYIGGDDDMRPTSPFPTDLVLATKNGATWSERTLVDASGEAVGDCPGTQNYCNFG